MYIIILRTYSFMCTLIQEIWFTGLLLLPVKIDSQAEVHDDATDFAVLSAFGDGGSPFCGAEGVVSKSFGESVGGSYDGAFFGAFRCGVR